ncbi:serine/threonine protein kinase, partial [Fischerella thermalis CCMEE 5319]
MLGHKLRGRYQIVQQLGLGGGFGATYIACDTDRPGNPKCLVKQLKPRTNDPNTLQIAQRFFKQEAEIQEELGNHDQIPRLLAYFEENQEFYLVQEFIE